MEILSKRPAARRPHAQHSSARVGAIPNRWRSMARSPAALVFRSNCCERCLEHGCVSADTGGSCSSVISAERRFLHSARPDFGQERLPILSRKVSLSAQPSPEFALPGVSGRWAIRASHGRGFENSYQPGPVGSTPSEHFISPAGCHFDRRRHRLTPVLAALGVGAIQRFWFDHWQRRGDERLARVWAEPAAGGDHAHAEIHSADRTANSSGCESAGPALAGGQRQLVPIIPRLSFLFSLPFSRFLFSSVRVS